MSTLKKFLQRLRNRINHWRSKAPAMLQGYRNADGSYAYATQIGSSSYIHNRKLLYLGEQVFIGQFNFIDSSMGIRIGDGCQITNYVSILNHSSHQSIRLNGLHAFDVQQKHLEEDKKGTVEIGAFTFVGPHVTIMPDTHIGKGCLVKAYSYVKGTFPDFSIIAGNPAKTVGNTQDWDKLSLDTHPQLRKRYDAWAKT